MITAKAVLGAAAVIAALILAAALVFGAPSGEQEAPGGANALQGEQERPGFEGSPSGTAMDSAEPVSWKSIVEPAPVSNPQTVVSLTFDDAFAGQYKAAEILSRYGIEGTFFITSGMIDRGGYLSLEQLRTIDANGHEIGGHSVSHPDLLPLPLEEASRQVCLDRGTLSRWGFEVSSFAYPFASSGTQLREVVEACGYNSARGLGDIATPGACNGCPGAETIPPANPYLTKAPEMVTSSWTLEDLKQVVLRAEETGGWTQLTFHHICDECSDLAVDPQLLERFAAWLANRSSVGTATRTVDEVIGGQVQPLVAPPGDAAPSAGVNGVTNDELEVSGQTLPRCWEASDWGDIKARFQTTHPGRTGNTALKLVVEDASPGAAHFIPRLDLGACAPGAVSGHSYSLSAWYTSTAETQFSVYLRSSSGVWEYWMSSPSFEPAGQYTQAAWTTPPLPEGATGLSFGLTITEAGELTTDDYAMYDKRGAPPPERGRQP